MLLTVEVLRDLLGTIALLALLAVVYGAVVRWVQPAGLAQVLLGGLFGGTAVLALFAPVTLAPSVIVDMRLLPMVLAGAFLGWPGAVVTFGLGAAMRIGIGEPGMVCGVAAMAASALIGLGWAWLYVRSQREGQPGNPRLVALLAPLSLLAHACIVLLPADLAWRVMATWPFFMPVQVVGVLVVGQLLEREHRMVAQERLLALTAARDPLTGLLNRRGFEAVAAQALRSTWGLALLVLDLDHFKQVNDRHGHAGGDAVLQALGPRLRETVGADSIVARFGGEEVVVLVPVLAPSVVKSTARRLCAAVRDEPFVLPDGTSITVTASVGAAWATPPVALGDLMTKADAALYEAKRAGRNGWHLSSDDAQRRRQPRRSQPVVATGSFSAAVSTSSSASAGVLHPRV